jgi:hypothetical protein
MTLKDKLEAEVEANGTVTLAHLLRLYPEYSYEAVQEALNELVLEDEIVSVDSLRQRFSGG